jgi:hypothetical protein
LPFILILYEGVTMLGRQPGLLFCCTLLYVAIPLSVPAHGADFCVNNADQFTSALDLASSNNEDNTIKLSSGDYVGTFIYATTNPSKLSISGGYDQGCLSKALNGISSTITTTNTEGTVADALIISAKYIKTSFSISDVTIKDATGTALKILSDSDVTLNNVSLLSNQMGLTFDIGYPLAVGPKLSVSNSTLDGNVGAVLLTSNSNYNSSFDRVSFSNNQINDNLAGAVEFQRTVNVVELNKNVVARNRGNSAILVQWGKVVTANDNIFKNNIAGANSGGALNASAQSFSGVSNVFTENECGTQFTAGPSGGAISLRGNGTIYLANNVFTNNKAGLTGAGSGTGGAADITSSGTATIVNNIIANNSAHDSGGGIRLGCRGSKVDVINNTVFGNTTISSTYGTGGGIYVESTTSCVANFYNNAVLGNSSAGMANDIYFDNDYDYDYVKSPANFYNNVINTMKFKLKTSYDASNFTLDDYSSAFNNPGSNDFTVKDGSALINKGDNLAPSLPAYSLGGTDRIKYGLVDVGAYEWVDTLPPVITEFTLPVVSDTTVVPLTLTATDNYKIDGYCLSESSKMEDCLSWTTDKPAYYTFDSATSLPKTLYAWVKDSVGYYSTVKAATTTISFPKLQIQLDGTGSGSVMSDVGGIACPGSCIASYNKGTGVRLVVAPDAKSVFGGWNTPACSGLGSCTVEMSGDQSITATFIAAPKAKVSEREYSSLKAAYNDSLTVNGSIIRLLEGALAESFTGGRSIHVSLEGGYNAEYSSASAETQISGPLLIAKGGITINKGAIAVKGGGK